MTGLTLPSSPPPRAAKMSDPTLEPCPFCGSRCFFNHEDANNSRGEEYVRAWVECTGCDMRSITKRVVYGMPDAKERLAGLWNRRVATPPADAALDDDALCESLIEASDMRWNGDVYVGDGADLMNLVRAALRARAVPEGFVMVPAGIKSVDRDFEYDASEEMHIPKVVVRFAPGKDTDAQTWDGRDKLAWSITLASRAHLSDSKAGGE